MRVFFTLSNYIGALCMLSLPFLCSAQNLSLSYERALQEIEYLEGTFDSYAQQAILHTSQGFSLYYGREKVGLDNYITLRNNNATVWKTQVDKFPDNMEPSAFYEHESGYFFVGDFNLSTGTGGIGRINKSSGNIEVKKRFTDLDSPQLLCIQGTYGGNIIVGGRIYTGGDLSGMKGLIRVVDNLGNVVFTRTSNNNGGLWGNIVSQIVKTKDNGYIISGIIFENTICGEPNNSSWWVAKLNSNLDVVWSRKYGDSNGTTRPHKLVVLDDNEIVALGNTYCTNGTGGGINNTGEGTWLVKLNASGALLKNTFVGVNFLDYTKTYTGLDISCDGNLVLVGTSGSLLGSSYFIEKFDANLEYIENTGSYFGLTQDKGYDKIGVLLGVDHTYLLFGLQIIAGERISFVAKTRQDDGCDSGPNPLLCESNAGSFSICENFDALESGNLLPQASPKFSLYSGSSSENATVTSEKAFSGTKSLKFTATSDIDFNIDRTIQSPTRLEWMTYVEAGKTGSWGLETSSPSFYALVTDLDNGNGTLYTMTSNGQFDLRATFTIPTGQWFKTALVFNNDAKTIETWINGQLIYTRTNHTSGQITDLNIYGTPGSQNNLFFVDDLLYYETNAPCITNPSYQPVCVNNIEYYNNSVAACAGYTSSEWTEGPCGVNPPTREITLDLDNNICGPVNGEVKVPVRVKDYDDIAALEIRIGSSNDNIAEVVGMTDIHPNSGIVVSDFALVNKKLVLTYADVSKSLPDGTILFSVRVALKGGVNSNANLVFEGESKALDNDFGKVGVVTDNGSVCINSSTFSISGKITNSKDKAISNVTVTLSNNQTVQSNGTGNYSFNNLSSGNYTWKPSLNGSLNAGVDITDLLLMRRHLQGLSLFSNPFTYVAADLNTDKTIDISDLLLIRRIIQGLTTQLPNNTPSWRFIPSNFSFSTINPLSGTIPDQLTSNNVNADLVNQNFIGVKYADLDHSVIPIRDIIIENRNAADVELSIQSQTASSGKIISVEVKCKNFIKGAVMQFSLQWPTDKLELQGLPAGGDLIIPGTTLFDQTLLANGKLGFIWETDDLVNGTTLTDQSLIYRLTFKILAPNGQTINIENSGSPKNAKFLNSDVNEVPLIIIGGNIIVNPSSFSEDVVVKMLDIYPNPGQGIVCLNHPIKGIHEVMMTDEKGKSFYLPVIDGSIDINHLSSGFYLVRCIIDGKIYRGKLVKVQ